VKYAVRIYQRKNNMKLFGIHIYESSETEGFNKGYNCAYHNMYLNLKELFKGQKKYPNTITDSYILDFIVSFLKIYRKDK
jgi:hypothetical protein